MYFQKIENRDLLLFYLARFFGTIGVHMFALTNAWQIYDITHSATSLGLIGLFQFVPIFLLCLPAGQAADRFEKHSIMLICYCIFTVGALFSATVTFFQIHSPFLIYTVVFLLGICRAFIGPSGQSFVPMLVPDHILAKTIATNTSVWQTASILGPTFAGLLLALSKSYTTVYAFCTLCLVLSTVAIACIRTRSGTSHHAKFQLGPLLEGIRFTKSHPILLGALSLDLFAVLLGGATALMPIFAKDILKSGPSALGLLRSAPGVGAVIMGIILARYPLNQAVGKKLLYAVFGFGVLTICFGLSRNLFLSIFILGCMGAMDLISVVVRQSLVQLRTPNHMRGKVSSVSLLFIGASNELGEIESGFTAAWFGTIPAVLLGGLGTCMIALLWGKLFPSLKALEKLEDEPSPTPMTQASLDQPYKHATTTIQ